MIKPARTHKSTHGLALVPTRQKETADGSYRQTTKDNGEGVAWQQPILQDLLDWLDAQRL